jgi:hypothetical protein
MESHQPIDTLQDIKRIMERSSRFISLSGLSGVSAGVFALIGSWVAYNELTQWHNNVNQTITELTALKFRLFSIAIIVFIAAIGSAFYFTWRKAKSNQVSIWDASSRRLIINLFIPIVAGACFIAGMLYHDIWQFVSAACLVFYGLALINASKYTYSDIRYLGIFEVVLGILNLFYIGYGLYFWALGFGVLHIVYGIIMWYKYERAGSQ